MSFFRNQILFAGNKIDSDARRYFNSAGITNYTEIRAANTLIKNLKGNNLWSQMIGLYLISPTSLAAAAVNARTPGTFDMTWVNNPSFATTGVTFNGSNMYGRTGIVPSVDLTANNLHLSYYSRLIQAPTSSIEIGSFVSNAQQLRYGIEINAANGTVSYIYNNAAGYMEDGTIDTSQGYYLLSRVSSTDGRLNYNGTERVVDLTTNGGSQPNIEIYIGAFNNAGTAASYSRTQCAFASIGLGFTPAQSVTINSLVQTYNTNVITGGRNV